jgi:pimeloyl-ACP methyl ester carboxylesterase
MREHIIFIPGVGGGAEVWQHQIQYLKDIATSEVIVLDGQNTRTEMADEVLAKAPPRFSLAGHSLGGWVAQEVAAKAPERVSKLFLCDTWTRDDPKAIEYIEGLCRDFLINREATLDKHFQNFLCEETYQNQKLCNYIKQLQRKMPTEKYVRQLKALTKNYGTFDLLPKIKAKTLVIHGRQDRVISEEECQFLADHIAHAKIALIEQSGHVTPLEQPQAFTAVMRLWLLC